MREEPPRPVDGRDSTAAATRHLPAPTPAAVPTLAASDSDATIRLVPVAGDRTVTAAGGRAGDAPSPPPAGFRYEIRDVLGRGGMGRVDLARDPYLDREVAIKTILQPTDPVLRQRFLEEARVAGQLEHPNIIPIHELGIDPDRGPFLVMKRIRGRSLKDVLDGIHAMPAPEKALADLLNAFVKTCEAVAYAHSRGVLHRDLKPDNVMVGEFGEVLVMDWGLAKVLGRSEPDATPLAASGTGHETTTRTVAGDVLGTPLYMSPEQARGEVGSLDERADVYSLGATLYEVLTLNTPFDAVSVQELLTQVSEGRVLPPGMRHRAPWALPRDLSAVALKAMARDRAGRYASVTVLKEDVEAWLAGRRLSAVDYTPWEVLGKFARRYKAILSTGAIAFAVLAVATLLFVLRLKESRDVEAREKERARREEARALDQERIARRRVAEGLSDQGDACLMAGQTLDARRRYEESLAEWGSLGESSMAPVWGITMAMRASPPPILEIDGWNGPLGYLALFPDGTMFLAGGPEDPPTLCETATGRRVRVFDSGAVTTTCAAFTTDGKTLVTGHADGTVQRHDVESGHATPLGKVHDSSLAFLVMRPDGRAFVTACAERGAPVRVWDLEGKRLRELQVGPTISICAAWSPAGGRLLVGCMDFVIRVWDEVGEQPTRVLRGHLGYVEAAAFSPDGRRVFSASGGGDVRLWDLATGQTLFQQRAYANVCPGVGFAPDGMRAVSGGQDRSLHVWDLGTGRLLRTLRGHREKITRLVLTPDGRRAVTTGEDGLVLIWDVERNWEDGEIPVLSRILERVEVSPDGLSVLACAQRPPILTLIDLASRREIQRFAGHEGPVYDICFFPDGRRAASASTDGTVRVWDLASGRQTLCLSGHRGMAMRVRVSPDGSRILSGDQFGGLHLWEAATGRELRTIPLVENPAGVCWIGVLDFLPDGRQAIAGALDGRLRLCDLEDGRVVRTLEKGQMLYFDGAVIPGGGACVVGGYERIARVVDLGTGAVLHRLDGHTSSLQSASYSRDGAQILTSSLDATVRLWDTGTGEALHVFRASPGETTAVPSAAFGATSRQILFAGRSGSVVLLDAGLPDRMREFQPLLKAAMARLQEAPSDAAALETLGRWYAFRGAWDWAAACLDRARLAGASIDGRLLLTACWQQGRTGDARRELAALRAEGRVPVLDLDLLEAGLRRADERNHEVTAIFAAPRGLQPGSVEGRLSDASPAWQGRAIDSFRLPGIEGQRLTIRARSAEFEPLILFATPHGGIEYLVPGREGDQVLTLPECGEYLLGCTSLQPGGRGAYQMELIRE